MFGKKSSPLPLTRRQCRAARALLGWSQERLAESAQVSQSTIANFESGFSVPMRNNLVVVRQVLEEAGIEFIPSNGGGQGVRLRVPLDEDDE
jgi:transcriptional regulator with XRE-family HTH domain